MRSYLVGVDGSDRALDALAWARSVASDDDEIVALHAWEPPTVTSYEGAVGVDTTPVETAGQQFIDRTIAAADDARVRGQLAVGHAGRALVDAADEIGPGTTLVVGHAGSGKAALLVGSIANYVVHHTDAPVVVVRGECRLPVSTVAVGVDDGGGDDPDAPSLAALRYAMTLPGVARVEVHHADFVPGVAAGPLSQPGLESEAEAAEDARLLDTAIERALSGRDLQRNGAEIVPVVGAGTGAFALIEASRSVDLVVIGTHGRSGLVELILGSTSLEVTAHAHCPVVVAR